MAGTDRTRITDAELQQHGVERVTTDVFLWGGYRYTNHRDALAAAKREGGQ